MGVSCLRGAGGVGGVSDVRGAGGVGGTGGQQVLVVGGWEVFVE